MNISVFKYTSDNWYPAYETTRGMKLVKISFYSSDEKFYVNASGDDDFYLDIEFEQNQEKIAWTLFCEIILQEEVSIDYIRKAFKLT